MSATGARLGRKWRTVAAWRGILTVGLLLVSLGCSDDGGVLSPAGGGVIEGRVTSPGYLGPVRVQAFSNSGGQQIRLEEAADSTGAFSLRLPFGRYLVLFTAAGATNWYSARGPVSRASADTLVLAPGDERIRADIAFGAIRLLVDAPRLLPSMTFECRVENDSTGHDEMIAYAQPRDDRLEWELPFVPPGTHRITLRTPHGQVIDLPFGGGPPEGRVAVQGGHFTDVMLSLPAATYVSGTVNGSWRRLHDFMWGDSRPVVFLRVPEHPGGGPPFTTAQGAVEWDGNFSFLVYGEEVMPSVLIGDVERGMDDFAFPWRRFPIMPGRETRLPEYLESGLFIILEPPGDSFTAAADIEVSDAGGRILAHTRVSSGSCVALCNLAPGGYLVRVLPRAGACRADWLETWYDQADDQAAAVPVTIGSLGEAVTVTVRLVRGGIISGDFVARPEPGEEPAPLHGLAVVAAGADSNSVSCVPPELDPSASSFRYRGLPDGDYRLLALIPYGGVVRHWWYPGTANVAEAGVIQIRGHAVVEGLSWLREW